MEKASVHSNTEFSLGRSHQALGLKVRGPALLTETWWPLHFHQAQGQHSRASSQGGIAFTN